MDYVLPIVNRKIEKSTMAVRVFDLGGRYVAANREVGDLKIALLLAVCFVVLIFNCSAQLMGLSCSCSCKMGQGSTRVSVLNSRLAD